MQAFGVTIPGPRLRLDCCVVGAAAGLGAGCFPDEVVAGPDEGVADDSADAFGLVLVVVVFASSSMGSVGSMSIAQSWRKQRSQQLGKVEGRDWGQEQPAWPKNDTKKKREFYGSNRPCVIQKPAQRKGGW